MTTFSIVFWPTYEYKPNSFAFHGTLLVLDAFIWIHSFNVSIPSFPFSSFIIFWLSQINFLNSLCQKIFALPSQTALGKNIYSALFPTTTVHSVTMMRLETNSYVKWVNWEFWATYWMSPVSVTDDWELSFTASCNSFEVIYRRPPNASYEIRGCYLCFLLSKHTLPNRKWARDEHPAI